MDIKVPNHLQLNTYFHNNKVKNVNYDKIFHYISEYTYFYDEKLDKYDEKRLFYIIIDYVSRNIKIYSFDKLLNFVFCEDEDNEFSIYGYKYIDKYDNIEHKQCETFIFELIQNINKNFDNIITIE